MILVCVCSSYALTQCSYTVLKTSCSLQPGVSRGVGRTSGIRPVCVNVPGSTSSSSSTPGTAGLLSTGSADVVEESGPVEYLKQESGPVEYLEEEEEGLEDEDMEDLRYEGDPLLDSDYEEGRVK